MSLLLSLWSYVATIGARIIAAIPWQVWAIIGCLFAVMWYGHYRENIGKQRIETFYKEQTQKEVLRQRGIELEALKAARAREAALSTQTTKLQEELDNVQEEFKKLVESKRVCVPKSITDRYSNRMRNYKW